MAQRTQTELAQHRGPTGNIEHDDSSSSKIAATVAVVTGVLGAIAGIIPKVGVLAIILGLVALVAGISAVRHGPAAPGFSRGRIGVALAVAALVLGVINIGIQLDWFDYFNPD